MRFVTIMTLAAAGGLLGACGAAGSFSGTVDGTTLAVGDAVFVTANAALGSSAQALYVVLANTPDICAQIRHAEAAKNETFFILELAQHAPSGDDPPVTAGTYTVAAPASTSATVLTAAAVFNATDAHCAVTTYAAASAGTVTLTAFTDGKAGTAQGRFAVVLNAASTVRGNFSAHNCGELATRFNSPPGQLACR